MAVQQGKSTPARRGNRRSHDRAERATLSVEPTTGEIHRRHHVSAEGYYRGRQVARNNDE